MIALLLLAVVASAQKDDFGFGAPQSRAQSRPPPAKPLWFIPSAGANEEKCNEEGNRALTDDSISIFESPTSEIFIPADKAADICIFFAPPHPQKWQLGSGVPYGAKSCSEGCCFYTPASSRKVQEIEAKVEENLPEWFRTPAGGCEAGPGGSQTYTSRLILNKDNNDSGSEAALCVRGKDGWDLLIGETVGCKGKCCVFNCTSCKPEE